MHEKLLHSISREAHSFLLQPHENKIRDLKRDAFVMLRVPTNCFRGYNLINSVLLCVLVC